MFEKVNPGHPDKVADRIAGALVDYAYSQAENPKIAVEVLIGHEICTIIAETSVSISQAVVNSAVNRIAGTDVAVQYHEVPQDEFLAKNQEDEIRCGDNGIFKGCPISDEQQQLSNIAHNIYNLIPYDGKYVISEGKLTICQSHAADVDLDNMYPNSIINPLGNWMGGVNVDSGATNRKLGSDMGDAVTGGGLHGKDLSKADVSVNIYCHLLAQEHGEIVQMHCAIGDNALKGTIGTTCSFTTAYADIVAKAKDYIDKIGGFEKLAEWGLI
ncbi:MAG: hypothetical protein IJE78_06155 [Bacteroidaceae bacterium]|nr:hypothetical protein [Bacteroidaceae bacterium]